jgi:hypothetical protein
MRARAATVGTTPAEFWVLFGIAACTSAFCLCRASRVLCG